MTHKEKIIATAYTGIMFVDGSELGEVYAYEEEKLGHGVIDIMHADEEFQQQLRNAVREDFLAMISENEDIKVIQASLNRIAQLATDRKNLNGVVMTAKECLAEIAAKARECRAYIEKYCK